METGARELGEFCEPGRIRLRQASSRSARWMRKALERSRVQT